MVISSTPITAASTQALHSDGQVAPNGQAQHTSTVISLGTSLGVGVSCLLIGNTLAEHLGAPIPGATLGMVFLAAIFVVRGGPDKGSARLFDTTVPHFPLLFVPAAAGVVASADLLMAAWVHVAAAILLGTTATIALTGWVAQRLLHRFGETQGQ